MRSLCAFQASSLSVASGVTSVVVTAPRSDGNAAAVVANASGVCTTNRCALVVGANRITTTVTAQDGMTKKAYVIVVTRRASRVEGLSEPDASTEATVMESQGLRIVIFKETGPYT